MAEYKLTVGLEVHAELNTRTKMFCDSKNDPNEARPNVNICPVCMAHPGTLPVINKEAVKSVLRLGLAVGGKLADYTEFDRKNYFYPDIPKGYQLSQYKYPLVSGGELAGVKLTRVHLEEDTARSSHEGEHSLVDYNRAGVPLMELVTEPVITSATQASKFAKELQTLLTYLKIAEANMEKGEMRIEANVSVSATDKFGTKVEVKNINSFKAVEKAIQFEYERQVRLLEEGGQVVQETRGWDENVGATFSQRVKEDSHDYRYFPDPDLPKLKISEVPEFNLEVLKQSLPELPSEKRERLLRLGLAPEHVEIYINDPEWGSYFEEVSKLLSGSELILASNYITSELKKPVEVRELAEVVKMYGAEELSSKGVKSVLKVLMEEGGEAQEIATRLNLTQINDENILRSLVEEVRAGEKAGAPTQFIVGQVIKKSGGRANPILLQKIVSENTAK